VLRLPTRIVLETFAAFQECGRGESECVVYWTGPATQDLVDAVEHPLHSRSPYGYELDDGWITSFFGRLAAAERSVKAQIHTHPGRAFHSPTDDAWPIVSQAGFVSVVIPNFAKGEQSLRNAWIGRLEAHGGWRRLTGAGEVFAIDEST